MTTHLLVDSVNTGLTKVLKDIASTYENVSFEDLSERYLVKPNPKKAKRRGHVSSYNIFVRETRPSIVAENPKMEFAEIAARVSKRWNDTKGDKKLMAELELKKQEYVQGKCQQAEQVCKSEKVAPAQVEKPAKKKGSKKQKA